MGWTPRKLQQWKQLIKKEKPPVVVIRQQYKHDAAKQNRAMFHQALLWTLREQTRQGRFWLLGHPHGRDLWKDYQICEEMHMASASSAILQVEIPGRQNHLRYQCAANHPFLTEQLVPQMRENPNAKDSLLHGILTGIRRLVRDHDPTRFQEVRIRPRRSAACGEWDRASTSVLAVESYYTDLTRDTIVWRQVLEQVQDTFRTSSVKQITLTEGTDLYQTVINLIPWEMTKVQIARAPAARRLPTNFPYTH